MPTQRLAKDRSDLLTLMAAISNAGFIDPIDESEPGEVAAYRESRRHSAGKVVGDDYAEMSAVDQSWRRTQALRQARQFRSSTLS
ncbi:hypothetical protein DVJ78_08260 [Humibacter sp. BT305]|nr:hypothetical protein DVJ78_08260 [Humibacter sp. BT305]